ncbi:MAG: hypothetical protein R3E54_00520 [Halioglobus sp.]
MTYAKALMQNQQPHIAEEVLLAQSKQRPNDPGLWYLLAEVQRLMATLPGCTNRGRSTSSSTGVLDAAEQHQLH